LNKVKNVKVENVVVGDKNKMMRLNKKIIDNKKEIEVDYKGINPINFGALSLGKFGEKVKMIKMDDYIKKEKIGNIKLIKVDVKGAEPLVFFRMQKTIEKNEPAIIYEKNPDISKYVEKLNKKVNNFDIDEYCFNLGYSYKIILPKHNYVLLTKMGKKIKKFCTFNTKRKFKEYKWNYEW